MGKVLRKVRALWIGVAAFAVLLPIKASACDFPIPSSSSLYKGASDIFVGKVVESPWMRGPDGKTVVTPGRPPSIVRFSVQRRFRGGAAAEITLPSMVSDCSYPFLQGESYLIHAFLHGGALDAGYPSRPLLLADATEALKYIEGETGRRPQALLRAQVTLFKKDGTIAAIPSTGNPSIHLDGAAGHFQAKITPVQPCEIVVPPGEYRAWLEIDGKPINERKTIRLARGDTLISIEGANNSRASNATRSTP